MKKRITPSTTLCFVLFVVLFLIMPVAAQNLPQETYNELEITKPFIENFAAKYGIAKEDVVAIFKKVPIKKAVKAKVLNLAARPLEKTATWDAYKKIFLSEKRITLGKKFYKENKAILRSSYKKYGVTTKIIVATLGMETIYGRNVGKHDALQSIMAQSFFAPRRNKFFQKELQYLLLLHFKEGFPIFNLPSSYSGALGPAQFMPSSINYYAVDANNDKKRSMLSDYEDIIFSIANYYKSAKWQKAKPIITKISKRKAYSKNNTLKKNVLKLKEDGVEKYYLMKPNFYAIKRYNNSNYYAMALFLLSKKL